MSSLVYIVLELLIAVLAVAGNVLVCWAVCLNSNLQSITNFFVVSLAVADIAVGLLAIPFAVTISTGFCSHFHGCLFIACFVLVLTQSSIFSLLAIAVDRYIAIKIPLRYNSLVTGQRAKGIIAVCWILSVVIGLTPMLGWNRRVIIGTNSTCPQGMTECLFEKVVTMDYMVYFNFFGCVLIPLFAMLAIYAWIFMAARRQLRQMEQKLVHLQGYAHREGSSSRSMLQREVHAAKSLAIIVGLFAVCWLPLHIINCFTLFCPLCDRPQAWVMYLAIILSHANSAVNPFIYAYRIRDFRHTFRRIIRQHFLWHENRLSIGNRNRGMGASSAPISVIETSCTVSNGYVLDANPIPGMVSCDKFTKQMPSKTRPQTEFQDLGYSLNGTLENSFPASSTQVFSLHTREEVPSIRDHVEIMTVKDCSAITNLHVRCLLPIRTSNSSDLAEVS
ncbi:adenosine receptor A2b-like [Carassius auratus]|uniref:Adenosine receptor A2 n=2 Tax=Cyprininae TaxID=2743694 RepID=A0A6P6M1G2_CARAU|nr:adenosine receptor A2b-like [Carassius auratus]XP_026090510.1 adenosine receptor A2b-like [Carassius auratus]XP_026090511.1 adenosine receptor A2b-like [Carassius auratus]